MLLDKWRFNTCPDLEILRDNFEYVSSNTILDSTLAALGSHHSLLDYLKEGAPPFADVTDKPELTIEPEDDN